MRPTVWADSQALERAAPGGTTTAEYCAARAEERERMADAAWSLYQRLTVEAHGWREREARVKREQRDRTGATIRP